jgi:hypothetical protein
MARSDDALAARGGQTAAWPRAHDPQWRGAAGAANQGGQQPVAGQSDPGFAPQGYHYPGQIGEQPAQLHVNPQQGAQAGAPRTQPPARPQQEYAPQFARYSGAEQHGTAPPQQRPAAQPSYADSYVPPRTAQPAQQWQADRQQPAFAPEAHYQQHGQQHVASQPAGNAYWSRQPAAEPQPYDPRHYDPAAYVPPGAQPAYHDQQYGSAQHQPMEAYPGAATAQSFAQGFEAHQQALAHEQHNYGVDASGRQDPLMGQSGAAVAGDPSLDAGYGADMVDAPPKRRRGLLVAGALVCAVAVGGGLAFVYKTFGQSGKRLPPPVVQKAQTPTKVAPADPQGKQFENAGKKVLARVGDDRPPPVGAAAPPPPAPAAAPVVPGLIVSTPPPPAPVAPAVAPQDPAAPTTRSVQTVQIGRDGAPTAPAAPVVPGAVVDNSLNQPPTGLRGPAPTQEAPRATPAPPKQQVARAAPTPPPPPAAAEPKTPTTPLGAQTGAPAPKKQAVPKATAPAAAAQAESGGSGYVAVLSSQKDSMAALRAFADLQQKYPGQLGNRQPEVQPADLGEKGVWQRLVVGPPASQQAAAELCSQLKAAGYAGCWTKKY